MAIDQEDNMEVEQNILDLECEYKEMETEDDGSFEGYASVFNNKDLGNDVIRQGAFTKSIAGRKASSVKLLYQHKTDEPIGVIDSLEEDKRGLKIRGRLAMGTSLISMASWQWINENGSIRFHVNRL